MKQHFFRWSSARKQTQGNGQYSNISDVYRTSNASIKRFIRQGKPTHPMADLEIMYAATEKSWFSFLAPYHTKAYTRIGPDSICHGTRFKFSFIPMILYPWKVWFDKTFEPCIPYLPTVLQAYFFFSPVLASQQRGFFFFHFIDWFGNE